MWRRITRDRIMYVRVPFSFAFSKLNKLKYFIYLMVLHHLDKD